AGGSGRAPPGTRDGGRPCPRPRRRTRPPASSPGRRRRPERWLAAPPARGRSGTARRSTPGRARRRSGAWLAWSASAGLGDAVEGGAALRALLAWADLADPVEHG